MRYLEDVVVGEITEFQNEYRVTEEEIVEMATRFDPQPFHIDKEAAEQSIFGTLTASSVHLFAMMIAIGTKDKSIEHFAAVSALGFDNMRTLFPARPGDVLKVRSQITDARASNSRPDCGIVKASNEMFNQEGTIVMTFEHAFLIQKKPD